MSERSDDDFGAPGGDNSGNRHRQRRRWFVDFESTLVGPDGILHTCTVYDLSPRGAGVGVAERHIFRPRDQLEFDLPGYGVILAEVRYRGRGYLGLGFLLEDEEEDEIEIARHLVAMAHYRRHEGRGRGLTQGHCGGQSIDSRKLTDEGQGRRGPGGGVDLNARQERRLDVGVDGG